MRNEAHTRLMKEECGRNKRIAVSRQLNKNVQQLSENTSSEIMEGTKGDLLFKHELTEIHESEISVRD